MHHICSKLLCRATSNIAIHSIRSAQVLAYKVYGPSPSPKHVPIIVLHDCLETKENWESMCKKLTFACQKSVIAVDARNHGDSPYCCAHDYKGLADDVLQLVDSQFELEKCILIGHSMGGRTAMLAALKKPERVASLVVVDISPVSTSSYMELTLPKMINVLMSISFKGMSLTEAKVEAKKIIEETKLFDNEAEVDAMLMNIGQLKDNTIGWKFNLEVLKKQVKNVGLFPYLGWKTYDGPTLFLAGKLSFCIPTDDLTKIQRYFPAARLLYIDQVRHNPHLEAPDGFLTAILKFLDFNSLIKPEPVCKL